MKSIQYQEKSGCVYMSSLVIGVADIECPNCWKLALKEGPEMATKTRTDFSCFYNVNAFH